MNVKNITTGIIAIFFCMLIAIVADAQTWRSLTTADGLAGNHINCMLEDRNGNLWFGTYKGLSQFNGSFTITHLSGMGITSLLESSDGNIWVGTDNGLYHYNRETWQGHLSEIRITSLLESSDGNIWVSDGRLLYRKVTCQEHLSVINTKVESNNIKIQMVNKITEVVKDGNAISDCVEWEGYGLFLEGEYLFTAGTITSLLESSDGTIWVGTDDGLYSYNRETWQVHLSRMRITSILESKDGSIWAGTRFGLHSYTWKEHLTWRDWITFPVDSSVTFLMESSDDIIWAGTAVNGIRYYVPMQHEEYLNGIWITSLLESSDGTIWVGTDKNGLYSYNRKTWQEHLSGMGITSILESKDGSIWAGTRSALYSYDGTNWKEYSMKITSLLESSDGTIWVGQYYDSLDSYDGTTWQNHFPSNCPPFGQRTGMKQSKPRYVLMESNDGTIWAAWIAPIGRDGLYSYDGTTWQKHLSGRLVYSLLESSGDIIWAGTRDGLYRYNGTAWQEHLSGMLVYTLLESYDGTIWVGTDKNGLYSYNRETWQEHLSEMRITSLLESSNGIIWVGTYENGVRTFDGITWRVTPVLGEFPIHKDIWPSEDVMELWALPSNTVLSILEDSDGKLWFRTKGGVAVYKPDYNPPLIEITHPKEKVVKTGAASLFIKWRAWDIRTETPRFTYQYRIDKNPWSKPNRDNFLTTPPMSDGAHTFYVRAIDSDFNYSEPAKLTIIVDTIRPNVLISSPADGEIVAGTVQIVGSVTDSDLEKFRVEYAEVDQSSDDAFKLIGEPEKEVVVSGMLAEWDTQSLKEKLYTIRLSATDKLEHRKDYSITVTLDNTLPTVKITSPQDNQKLSGVISIKGQVSDDNLKSYELMWTQPAEIDNDTTWYPIASEELGPSDATIEQKWDSSAVYGMTKVRLLASDQAGNTNTSDVVINLNNETAKPTALITSPDRNAVIAGVKKITGTADDPTLASYTVDFGTGEQPTAWTDIVKQSIAIEGGTLANWDTTELQDGKYTLRLTATDSNGYSSVFPLLVIVDNTKPSAIIRPPDDFTDSKWIATGDVEIHGTASDENFEHYLLEFGQGNKPEKWTSIEGEAKKTIQNGILRTWSTAGLEGEYTLQLTVTDKAGLSSVVTQPLTLDNQPPQAMLKVPTLEGIVTGMVEIIGTASDKNFKEYKIFIAPGEKPRTNDWQLIGSGVESQTDDVLADWNTEGLEGVYSIKLIVEDKSGQAPVEDVQIVTVDNTNPQAKITRPTMDEQVGGDIQILGTAYDENFTEYIVEYGAGTAPDDSDWELIVKSMDLPETERLCKWNTMGKAGEYSIRLRVLDKVGHEVATQVNVLVQATVVRSQGGEIKERDQKAKIYIPPNSLPSDTIITINQVSEQELKENIGWEAAYDFEPFDLQFGQQPYKPAAITIRYPSHLPEVGKTLAIYRFQKQKVDGSVTWVLADRLGGTINRSNHTITSATTRLGRFVIIQEPENGLGAYVKITQLTCQPRVISPNGGRFSTTGYISFHLNQKSKVTVKIYNLEGYLKKTLIEREQLPQGKNLLDWNGRDSNNDVVPSNAYVIVVTAEKAEKVATKTVVVLNDR